jgi:hypothetical protein
MTISLDHLLPAPDEALRCAEHARRIAVDPAGTAIRADRVILVAAPLPWPKPALAHPGLQPLVAGLQQSVILTRVLAHIPEPDGSAKAPARGGGGGTELVVFDRAGGSAVERRYRTASHEGSSALVRALAAGDEGAARSFLTEEHAPARATVLLCTQGSHDVCCGTEGTRLAAELRARADATLAAHAGTDPLQLFRVSHTGGHRFAPTAMTLPDGRMWAGLTSSLVEEIMNRQAEVAAVAPLCRGWWGADTGPAQVAEVAVFARWGWSLEAHDRRVTVAVAVDGAGEPGDTVRCTVTVTSTMDRGAEDGRTEEDGTERWEVVVAPGRTVPTIACRRPGGLPAKPAQEYEILGLSRTG